MFDKLFTPITIKDMTLRNRIIMPAMGTRFTEDRFVNEKHIAYHVARIRKGTGMLTIGVGRINDPQQAEDILEADKVDMVVMGRAQLADPDFCNKCKEGRVEDIDRCVGCNQGCLDGFADLNMPHITCLRNPAIGHETECAAGPQPPVPCACAGTPQR